MNNNIDRFKDTCVYLHTPYCLTRPYKIFHVIWFCSFFYCRAIKNLITVMDILSYLFYVHFLPQIMFLLCIQIHTASASALIFIPHFHIYVRMCCGVIWFLWILVKNFSLLSINLSENSIEKLLNRWIDLFLLRGKHIAISSIYYTEKVKTIIFRFISFSPSAVILKSFTKIIELKLKRQRCLNIDTFLSA